MLFENGHIADAVPPYLRAVELKPTTRSSRSSWRRSSSRAKNGH